MGREMKRQMKSFKEFEKDTIFTYEWTEFCERTYIDECRPDNNMVTTLSEKSNKEEDEDS